MNKLATLPAALLLAAAVSPPAQAQWVASWYASPQARWDKDFVLPVDLPAGLQEQTVRERVQISAGGKRVRLVLSNRYGTTPLVVGDTRIGVSGAGSAVVAGSERAVTFGGRRTGTAAPGAPLVSDPIDMPVAAHARLTVSTYFPSATPVSTFHWGAQQTGYLVAGNAAGAADLGEKATRFKGRMFLSAVLVDAGPQARSVVVFGDSITDGNGSTPDQNRRWPDYLARRLAPAGVAVANAGISGARVLGDRMGANALARFEQDVLAQPGVAAVIVMMGINDIGWPGSPFAPGGAAMRAQTLIDGYRQLIASAHARNVRIMGATMVPFENALEGTPFVGHYSAAKEKVRVAVNEWIRSSGEFDAVVDFDALLRDPQRPIRLLPAYDSGDHLHPGDAGYEAMANAVDLAALLGPTAVR